jgi:hypothetical protein
VSARRSGNTTGDDSAELPNGDAARGPAALRDAGETLAIDAPLIVSCGTPQVMTLQPSLAEAAAERWRPSARRWHVAPAELTSATLSRFASRSDEGTGRGERAARADSPGQRFDGRTRWWRFGPHDPNLCDDTEKAEGNEATFAFRLRRSARVIRPETLMMARDQTSGETFPVSLRWQLEHLVLSHHGQLEFGSPKVPQTLEALTLHHLDNLDAKLAAATSVIESDVAADGNWTNYNPAMGRKWWKSERAGRPAASS